MSRTLRILGYSSVFLLVVSFTGTGCVAMKKQKPPNKREQSLCDLSHLGKNKYYYSGYYQRKLQKSIRKIGVH